MPKQRYERREPTHDWSQIRPLLKDPIQIQYEILRPIVLFGISPQERAAETGISKSSLYAKANLFDQAGMASLLPPIPPPEIPKQDKRTLPPPIRQAIIDAKAEHPGLSLHEIARMCYVQFNRKPSPHTIQLVLANGPSPSRTTRRFPRFDEIDDPAERRRVIIRLHADGWMPHSIADYLGTSRQTIHTTLRRWAEEQFAGLEDKPHTRKRRALKTDLKAMNAVKRLQENPELGAYRIHTALLQQGINLSARTCGRILALNRKLYHLQMPVKRGRPKKEMPFRAERRHQYWTTDIRYLDMHQLGGGMIYCISILENFSRAILASAISRNQNTEAYLAVLYAAIRRHGVPEALVSDNGGVFRSQDALRIYKALGIQKVEIEKRQAWQSYIESNFNAQRRLADWYFERAQTWEDLLAAHEKWLLDFNYQHHFAHEQRQDGCHSPAAVLGWVKGMQPEPERIYRAFSAVGEMRTITKAGYVRFRDYLLYGEQNLAGERALVNLFQDVLTLEYREQPLSRYLVEWQPDEKHLGRVGNPRLYNHPYQSPQLELWPTDSVEWYLILRANSYGPRRKKKRLVFLQFPLL
ncbi:MAG: helix-turn-helix domain-containing protein [Ktedonobacteraceae bacterium]|nr:helix-turn-helix domain-containing protein [Ktedonobacteraceae bacterium]